MKNPTHPIRPVLVQQCLFCCGLRLLLLPCCCCSRFCSLPVCLNFCLLLCCCLVGGETKARAEGGTQLLQHLRLCCWLCCVVGSGGPQRNQQARATASIVTHTEAAHNTTCIHKLKHTLLSMTRGFKQHTRQQPPNWTLPSRTYIQKYQPTFGC